MRTLRLPKIRLNKNVLIRSALAIGATYYILFQLLSNLPYGPLTKYVVPRSQRLFFNNLGQYQKGWGMFSATATNTSEVDLILIRKDGPTERIPLVKKHPGFLINPWNEIGQDLQFDDNNGGDHYRDSFMRRECIKRKDDGVARIQLEQRIIGIRNPYNPNLANVPQNSTNIIADRNCTL